MSNRQNRRGRGRALPNALRSAIRAQHRVDFAGSARRGVTDPPRVVRTPWNSLVIASLVVGENAASNLCVTPDVIRKWFTTQSFGSEVTFAGQLRIQSAQVWHIIPNGELNNEVRCRFNTLIPVGVNANDPAVCSRSALSSQEDFGTPARNATVRFVWPRTHQDVVFQFDDPYIIFRITLGPNQQVLAHTRILWRYFGGSSNVRYHVTDGIQIDELSRLFYSDLQLESEDCDVISID
jgi:hypothetical protein